jgi:membrane fusion protein, multidrug efflux system
MKRIIPIFPVLVVLLAAVRLSPSRAEESAAGKSSSETVAKVKVVAIVREAMTQTVSAYGTVAASPDGLQIIIAPFECRVRRVEASNGQQVAAGETLVEVDPSPESQLLIDTARSALTSAQKNLTNTQVRFDLKLATAQDLLQAQQAAQEAQLRVTSLEGRGLGQDGRIVAPGSGIVGAVDARRGLLATAGSPLVELSTASNLEVRLGVEPEDLAFVRAGQRVTLELVSRPTVTSITAQVRVVARSVDPSTGLVDVFASILSSEGLLMGDHLRGRIETATKDALAVPRSAILPEADRHTVFTVKDGHAVRHAVQLGLQTDAMVELIGGDLQPGDDAVVLGNYELEDGMPVQTESSP